MRDAVETFERVSSVRWPVDPAMRSVQSFSISRSLVPARSDIPAWLSDLDSRTSRHLRAARRPVAGPRLPRRGVGTAEDTHGPVSALAIAAEPEEIVGHATLDHALRALDAGSFKRRAPEADMGTLLGIRDDPDVACMAIRGAESYGAVGIDGHCEAGRASPDNLPVCGRQRNERRRA